jgi:FkbH-like protein
MPSSSTKVLAIVHILRSWAGAEWWEDAIVYRSEAAGGPGSGRANAAPRGNRAETSFPELSRPGALISNRERRDLSNALAKHRDRIAQAWWRTQFDPERLQRFQVPGIEGAEQKEITRSVLLPLLGLLRSWLRTGEARYSDVYLDERLRFAPHLASLEKRTEFFDETLPADEQVLLGLMQDVRQREKLRALLEELHAPLRSRMLVKPLRILALGDCLMNELRVALVSRSRAESLPLDFRQLYFSALYRQGLPTDETLGLLRDFRADFIALSFLSYKGIAPYAALMREAHQLNGPRLQERVQEIVAVMRDFLAVLRDHTDAPFLVHNASGLPLSHLRRFVPLYPALSRSHRRALSLINAAVAEMVAHTPNAILVDEAEVARSSGLRQCESRLIPPWVAWGAQFHTSRFGEYLAPTYLDLLRSYRELARCKVLAVDFDNTLWDGVMADGLVEQRHSLQQLLLRLKDAGILLVALSKNDPKNIRWDEMTLKPDHFVLHKVGWNLKVQSIDQAARELDVGLDTFVLLDDNPAERELVRTQLPSVCTLDPNSASASRWLERMLSFPNTRQTDEARRRTELYREQAARKAALGQRQFDYAGMMTSLGLRAHFGRAEKSDLQRAAELVQRTNQFNTSAIRYSRQQLAELISRADYGVYQASLADKFGNLGMVAIAVVRRDGLERTVESFVMSCRAMGFELERLVLRRLLDAEGGEGVRFIGRYVRTERNSPSGTLFSGNGFMQLSETNWVLEPSAARPDLPPWFS